MSKEKHGAPDFRKDKDAEVEFFNGITEELKEEVFNPDGTPTVTVALKGDRSGYRKKPLLPNFEFFLTGAYRGKRKNLIFTFEKADAWEFKHAEIEVKDLDTVFPMFGPALAHAFDIKTDKEDAESVLKLLQEDFQRKYTAKIEEEKREKERDLQEVYGDNPLFGAF